MRQQDQDKAGDVGEQDAEKSEEDPQPFQTQSKPRHRSGVSRAAEFLASEQLRVWLGDTEIKNPRSAFKNRAKRQYTGTCKYTWEHVVLDECQHVRSIFTPQHKCVALLERNSLIGLTATPMCNQIVDLYGYWSLLGNGLAAEVLDEEDENSELVLARIVHPDGTKPCQSLRELYTVWSIVRLPSAFEEIPYELFDPSLIVRLGSNVSTIVGDDCLPFLFRASIMMRTMADTITGLGNEKILIGAEIPPLRVMTIEVRYSSADQRCHDEVYRFWIKEVLKPNTSGEAIHGRQKMAIYRALSLLALSPRLYDFLCSMGRIGSLSDSIANYISADDFGFTAYFQATCRDPAVLRPYKSIEQAYYLICQCPRLREMLRILDKEGAFDQSRKGPIRPRFLIISYWPIVCWMVEMVIRRFGLKSEVIIAANSAGNRAAVAEFNDPQSKCQVLNTTYVCGGTGLNVHECCNVVILIEPAPNFNLEMQAIGRVHRLGQVKPQRVYRLFQEHTINRYTVGWNIKNMLPQIAAQYHGPLTEKLKRQEGSQKWDDDRRSKAVSELCEDWLRRSMRVAEDFPYCVNLLDQNLLGVERDGVNLRSERKGFTQRGEGFPAVQAPKRPTEKVVHAKTTQKREALDEPESPPSKDKRPKIEKCAQDIGGSSLDPTIPEESDPIKKEAHELDAQEPHVQKLEVQDTEYQKLEVQELEAKLEIPGPQPQSKEPNQVSQSIADAFFDADESLFV